MPEPSALMQDQTILAYIFAFVSLGFLAAYGFHCGWNGLREMYYSFREIFFSDK